MDMWQHEIGFLRCKQTFGSSSKVPGQFRLDPALMYFEESLCDNVFECQPSILFKFSHCSDECEMRRYEAKLTSGNRQDLSIKRRITRSSRREFVWPETVSTRKT
ncbi:hypothetical protein TNCT_538021 [Trichonephila clavata]|uniref:Uncharacterized protein n=1 Tax=Trichonephila clavata TaxID=2740835 RepID=A0A8X6GKE6_TRICU|nr:hypothetical protein TNCT_538021 [Trichonephila clavata]